MAEAIRIDGLAEFSRSLRKLDAELPKALRIALNQGSDLVIGAARPHIPSRSGRARGSLKARSTRTAVRVSEGGPRASYVPWLDFGGKVGRRKSVRRPFLKEGRYLYAAYFAKVRSGAFEQVMTDALLGVVRQAGLGVE